MEGVMDILRVYFPYLDCVCEKNEDALLRCEYCRALKNGLCKGFDLSGSELIMECIVNQKGVL